MKSKITIEVFNERYESIKQLLEEAGLGIPDVIQELPIKLALYGFVIKPTLDFKDTMPPICKMAFIPEVDGVNAAWYYVIPAEDYKP
jgi:hypothetical protein